VASARGVLKRGFGDEELTRPDLVVEVDISRSVLSRLKIYAAMGVPEVWRWKSKRLQVYRLEGNDYQRSLFSPIAARFPLAIIQEYLELRTTKLTSDILRQFRARVRELLQPRND
jgi:Uma2 family endonuclease